MSNPPRPSSSVDALIIGAGISGLSLAYQLTKNHQNILVSESRDHVGGNIITSQAGGYLWEAGPHSFAPNPALLKLIVELGLESDLILADRSLPRYVYWQGQLLPVPMNPLAFTKTPLLSWVGKLRAVLGLLGFVPPALGQTYTQQQGEETVAQFFERHWGREVKDRLITPLVSSIYAGDIEQLSVGAAFRRMAQLENIGGGLLAGAILSRRHAPRPAPKDPSLPKTRPGTLGTFKQGLQALPEALARQLGALIQCRWRLVSLARTTQHTYLADFETPSGNQQIEAKTVVLTTPAPVSGRLLHDLAPQVSQALSEFEYPPVASVSLAYPQSAFRQPLQGFGHLIPRGQGIHTLGTIWASALFPERSPQGWQLLSSYLGGATDVEMAQWDGDRIAATAHQDLQQILLKPHTTPKVLAVHVWKQAIPQYNLGHYHRLQRIKQHLTQLPGLYLCSNYLDGVTLGDCLRRSLECTREIHQYLLTKPSE